MHHFHLYISFDLLVCACEVNRFRLISVMDVIIRQHFEAMNREDFLQRVKQYAKKLKVYCDAVPGSKRDSVEGPAAKQAESNQKSPPKGRAENGLTNSTRDSLISAMLIEPEVLHLVFCFQHPIQSLFDCYAPKGYMQFTDFWQFCVDFQLAPRFVTEQQLKKAYEAAECFIILPPRLVREPPRGAFKARARRGAMARNAAKPRLPLCQPALQLSRNHQKHGKRSPESGILALTQQLPPFLKTPLSCKNARQALVRRLSLRHCAA